MLVHIPGGLIFGSDAVDVDLAAICILDLHADSVDVELARKNFLFHNSILLNLFFGGLSACT